MSVTPWTVMVGTIPRRSRRKSVLAVWWLGSEWRRASMGWRTFLWENGLRGLPSELRSL